MPHPQVPTRVDAGQVRSLQAAVEQLRTQDQTRGGGAIPRAALQQFDRARRMVDNSDYTETVGCSDRSIKLYQSVLDDHQLAPRNRTCWEAAFASALLDAGDRAQALARGRAILPALAGRQLTSARPLARLQDVRWVAEEIGDEEFCLLYGTAQPARTSSA